MPHSETLHRPPRSNLAWPIASASKLVWVFLIAAIYYGNPERQTEATTFMMLVAYVVVFIPAALVLLVAVPLACYRIYRDDRLRTRSLRLPLAFGTLSLLAALTVLVAHAAYQMGWPNLLNRLDGIL